MFDSVILLAGVIEQPALAAMLRRFNPNLSFIGAESDEALFSIPDEQWARARLIAFTTPVIVPGAILDAVGYGAYNFHPGPPEYPGWLPATFATYNRETKFGVTAHHMIRQVDAGPIIGVKRFSVPEGGLMALEYRALAELVRLFVELAPQLAGSPLALPSLSVSWANNKGTRRQCAEFCNVTPSISPDELDRRITAFGGGQFGLTPEIRIGRHVFRYVSPPESSATETGAKDRKVAGRQMADLHVA